jgi:hypothetical protein
MAGGKKATPGYARLHRGGLTPAQQNAVALLVAGKNDTETAAALGLNRVTVTRWRLYSPAFQAELNVRRAEVWAVGAAKLQALVSEVLDVIAEGLREGDSLSRLAVAREVLKLAGAPPVPSVGPTDPDTIVRRAVHERRRAAESENDRREIICGLPSFADHCEQVWEELNERAGAAAPPEPAPVARVTVRPAHPAAGALTMSSDDSQGTSSKSAQTESDGEQAEE